MTHYFMFSEGSYSDYMVGGLYACDHEVTKEDWKRHLEDCDALYEAKCVEIFGTDKRWWLNNTPERSKAWADWRMQNDPDASFVAKHNMTKIEYTELWR